MADGRMVLSVGRSIREGLQRLGAPCISKPKKEPKRVMSGGQRGVLTEETQPEGKSKMTSKI